LSRELLESLCDAVGIRLLARAMHVLKTMNNFLMERNSDEKTI